MNEYTNATVGHGGKVHITLNGKTLCGAGRKFSGIVGRQHAPRATKHEANCKACLKLKGEQAESTDKFASDLYKSLFGA